MRILVFCLVILGLVVTESDGCPPVSVGYSYPYTPQLSYSVPVVTYAVAAPVVVAAPQPCTAVSVQAAAVQYAPPAVVEQPIATPHAVAAYSSVSAVAVQPYPVGVGVVKVEKVFIAQDYYRPRVEHFDNRVNIQRDRVNVDLGRRRERVNVNIRERGPVFVARPRTDVRIRTRG